MARQTERKAGMTFLSTCKIVISELGAGGGKREERELIVPFSLKPLRVNTAFSLSYAESSILAILNSKWSFGFKGLIPHI